MTVRPTPSRSTLILRGLTRACPVCGRRRLMGSGRSLEPDCPRCGFRFERSPGHFVGAVGINTIITFGMLLLTLLAGIAVTWPDVEAPPLLVATVGVAIVVPIAIHPTTKTLWAAIDLAMRPLEPGEALGGAEEGAP